MAETYDVLRDVNLPLIGEGRPRYEARAKVTGTARYAADEPMGGALHAALVTTPHASGRIVAIDDAAARAVPGVRAVLTHRNPPQVGAAEACFRGGAMQSSRDPMGTDAIAYAGQAVAMVVAETPEAARSAADRVAVGVAPSGTPVASMHAADAPAPELLPEDVHAPILRGDVEAALAEADAVVRAEYRTPMQHHNPIELYSTGAEWRNGILTVYVPSQWVSGFRAGLAEAFDMPTEMIRVISRHVGGGFGSKGTMLHQTVLAAAAARDLDAPVRLEIGRDQMFTVGSFRAQTTQTVAVGLKDGRLSALDHRQDSQTSRFDTFFLPGTEQTTRMYDWAAIRGREGVARTDVNTPGFMRAPAEVPALFGLESAVDELAVAAGVDPVELRLASDAAGGEPVDGLRWTSHGLAECLRRGADAVHHATGIRLREAPIRMDHLLGA